MKDILRPISHLKNKGLFITKDMFLKCLLQSLYLERKKKAIN